MIYNVGIISFEKHELHLLKYLDKQPDISRYIKQLIQKDIDESNRVFEKKVEEVIEKYLASHFLNNDSLKQHVSFDKDFKGENTDNIFIKKNAINKEDNSYNEKTPDEPAGPQEENLPKAKININKIFDI